jgi:hypothetical protein
MKDLQIKMHIKKLMREKRTLIICSVEQKIKNNGATLKIN